MENKIILGIHIKDVSLPADRLQEVFTKYGGCIRTRLGINESIDKGSKGKGLILLELMGEAAECRRLQRELRARPGIEVKKMVFN